MRTNSRQLAIVACSFSPFDLLAVGPIDSIRFHALCRGKSRFVRVRSAVRAVQAVIDSVGLAIWTVFAACRDTVMAGAGYVTSKTKAGYDHTRDGVSFVGSSLANRVSRAWDRVVQVGRVLVMVLGMYGLFGVSRTSRVAMGWTSFATTVTVPEPDVEPEAAPVVALAESMPMMSAARVTTASEPATNEKADLVKRAQALIAEGKSKRATAKELGMAESTLRCLLKRLG